MDSWNGRRICCDFFRGKRASSTGESRRETYGGLKGEHK